jgi:hypothetical protein
VNSSEAARPMPLPAPVMMTDLPSRRPMKLSVLEADVLERDCCLPRDGIHTMFEATARADGHAGHGVDL